MKNLKLSLINNDYSIQAHTDLNFSEHAMNNFVDFLNDIKEELVTGQTAYFEIEGAEKEPVIFTISQVSEMEI